MKGYKAFKKGLICRDKQYAENTVFEEDKAEICNSGMHFCKDPLEVLEYYPLVDENGEMSEFAEVEALDECKTDDNKKFCTKKLKIGAKLNLFGFISPAFNCIYEKATQDNTAASGDYSKLAASGNYSKLAASGYNSQLAASGYNSQLAASGDNSKLAASGDNSKLAASGDYSKLAASGDYSQIISTGKHSVICCAGHGSMAKGKIGSWITLSEWKYSEEEGCRIPTCVKTKKIDGVKIKEDTFYQLKNGRFVEVKE